MKRRLCVAKLFLIGTADDEGDGGDGHDEQGQASWIYSGKYTARAVVALKKRSRHNTSFAYI